MALAINTKKKISALTNNVVYKDIASNLFFKNDDVDIQCNTNEDAVKQSILNILLTNPGERLFNSIFGSELNKMLFENITPQTTLGIVSLIKSGIENFEPRANLIDVVASPSPDENAYNITIIFSVINKNEPQLLEFLLYRVR